MLLGLFAVLLAVSGVSSKCVALPPSSGFQDSFVYGQEWYMYLQRPGFKFQNDSLRCGTFIALHNPVQPLQWRFLHSYVDTQDRIRTVFFNVTQDKENSGLFNYHSDTAGGPKRKLQASIICYSNFASTGRIIASYNCNPEKDEAGIFILTSKRMTQNTLGKEEFSNLIDCLTANKIDAKSLVLEDNSNCPNP